MKSNTLEALAIKIINSPDKEINLIKKTLIEYVVQLNKLLQPSFFIDPCADPEFKLVQIFIEDETNRVARLIFNESQHMIINVDTKKGLSYQLFTKDELAIIEQNGEQIIKDYELKENKETIVISGVKNIHDYLSMWKEVYNKGLIDDSLSKIRLVAGLYNQIKN